MRLPTELRRDRRGASALEFAIVLPVLVLLTGGLADLGLLWRTHGQLAVAVNAGVQDAMLLGSAATSTKVQTAMTSASSLTGITALASDPACKCIVASALTAQICTTACSDSTMPGTYMTLTASYTYSPIMPLFSHVAATARSESATVRLK